MADIDFEEFVKTRAASIEERLKERLGDRWDFLREEYEEDIKALTQWTAKAFYHSLAGKDTTLLDQALGAITKDFLVVGLLEARSVFNEFLAAVKDEAKDIAEILFKSAAKAGIEALKESFGDVEF